MKQRQACENMTVFTRSYSLDLALYNFWRFLKIKMTMKSKCSESIQDIEATRTAQPKTVKRISGTASGRGRDDEMHVFEAKGEYTERD